MFHKLRAEKGLFWRMLQQSLKFHILAYLQCCRQAQFIGDLISLNKILRNFALCAIIKRATTRSSYDEAKAAIFMTLECILVLHEAAAICIDNKSPSKAIQSGSAVNSDLRRMFDKQGGMATHLQIPGDQGIAHDGEECACAKQVAAIIDGAPRSVSFVTASSLVYPLSSLCKKWSSIPCTGLPSTPRNAVFLGRLQSGHTPLLNAFAN